MYSRRGLRRYMARRDTLTQDLFFEVPTPVQGPASLGFGVQVAHLVSACLKESEFDRHEIAARMSRLTGREVSKYMLDAWSAESRENFNLPFYLVPAFEEACGPAIHTLTNWLAGVRGGRLYIGRDAVSAELGQIERKREQLGRRAKELRKRLGESE